MADKRKIRRLEEELEESEAARKKAERALSRLQKEHEEVTQQTAEEKEKVKRSEFDQAATAELLDAKGALRKNQLLEEQLATLRSQLSDLKSKLSEAQRNNRESEYDEVEKQAEVRAAEAVQGELREEIEKLKSAHELQIKEIREDHDRQMREIKRMRKGLQAGTAFGKSRDADASGAAATLASSGAAGGALDEAAKRELRELRIKLDAAETAVLDAEKVANRKKAEFVEQLEAARSMRERAETKLEKAQLVVKGYENQLDAIQREKANLDKSNGMLAQELRDTKRLMAKSQAVAQRSSEEAGDWKRKARELEILQKDSSSGQEKIERDLAKFRQERDDELERTRTKAERTIAQLKQDVDMWKDKCQKAESRETELSIENKRLSRALEKVQDDMKNAAREADRSYQKLERQLALHDKASAEELSRARDLAQKAEERRRREQDLAETLQEEARAVRDEARKQQVETKHSSTSSVEAEKAAQTAALAGDQVKKLRTQLQNTEDQIAEQQRQAAIQLKEKDRTLRELSEELSSAISALEKEHAAEKKAWSERDRTRGEEYEKLSDEVLESKRYAQKLENELRQQTESVADLQMQLDDAKEDRKLDSEKHTARLKNVQDELRVLQDEHHSWATEQRKLETQLREREDEYTDVLRNLEDQKVNVEELTLNLKRTETAYAEDKAELTRKVEKALGDLARIEGELNTTRADRDSLAKAKVELEKRIAELEFYFMPLVDQDAAAMDLSGPAKKLLKRLRVERYGEVEAIRKRHAKTRAGATVEELHSRLASGLQSLPGTNKDVTAHQLLGLMQALEAADYAVVNRLKVCVALVEGLVDPEIIREVRMLTEYMVEDSLHFLDTPETVVLLTQRAVDEQKYLPGYEKMKRSDLLNFRDLLLKRLTTMRAKRMGKTRKEVKQGILDEVYSSLEG